MNLCVIIPAYNHLAEVLTCLNSLQGLQAGSVAYHVQDDCSPDVDFRAVIPRASATVIRNETNLGFGVNCNAAAKAALADFPFDVLLFVNQDVYAVPEWSQGWDAKLLNGFQDPEVAVVGARLLFPNGSIQSAGGTFDTAAQPIHRCLGWSNPKAEECDQWNMVEWTTGAAFAVLAPVFKELNGFDERYERGYFEDVDYCLRAKDRPVLIDDENVLAREVLYNPDCTFIHTVGTSGGSPYFTKNALRFKAQWVDSGLIKPGQLRQIARYW